MQADDRRIASRTDLAFHWADFHEANQRMTDGYTPAKIAYRELRSAIGPWAKTNGYARWTGTQWDGRNP